MSPAPAPAGPRARCDVAILGGGIAGLWLLARLDALGFSAVLLQAGRLAEGQTIAAQGIIHGGLKYALDLRIGEASRAIAGMPALWRRCLAGDGEVDLTAARVLADRQLFWMPGGALAAAAGFLASKAVRSGTERVPPADWPEVLRGGAPVGAVYRLDEPVLDVASVVRALAEPRAGRIRGVERPEALSFAFDGGRLAALVLPGGAGAPVRLEAGCFVFVAGAGNEALLSRMPEGGRIATQRRPLQMLLLKGMPGPLFAHCFDRSDKPRLTVTSHVAGDGRIVWYVGGALAENAAGKPADELFAAARDEFAALLPGLDLGGVGFAALPVDRAEPLQPGGRRPDAPVVETLGGALVAWPSKLAFAPRLAAAVLDRLRTSGLRPGPADLGALAGLPFPGYAEPPWERLSWH